MLDLLNTLVECILEVRKYSQPKLNTEIQTEVESVIEVYSSKHCNERMNRPNCLTDKPPRPKGCYTTKELEYIKNNNLNNPVIFDDIKNIINHNRNDIIKRLNNFSLKGFIPEKSNTILMELDRLYLLCSLTYVSKFKYMLRIENVRLVNGTGFINQDVTQFIGRVDKEYLNEAIGYKKTLLYKPDDQREHLLTINETINTKFTITFQNKRPSIEKEMLYNLINGDIKDIINKDIIDKTVQYYKFDDGSVIKYLISKNNTNNNVNHYNFIVL